MTVTQAADIQPPTLVMDDIWTLAFWIESQKGKKKNSWRAIVGNGVTMRSLALGLTPRGKRFGHGWRR